MSVCHRNMWRTLRRLARIASTAAGFIACTARTAGEGWVSLRGIVRGVLKGVRGVLKGVRGVLKKVRGVLKGTFGES